MSRLLTLKDIAKQLDVPESSVRKYRELFSAFIPSIGSGRARRYRSEAVEILQEIRNLREELHMPWDAITDKLAEKYPMDATPQGGPRQTAMDLAGEVVEPAPAAVRTPAQTASPIHPAKQEHNGDYLRKIVAVSEKQTMIVNAMALEMMRAVEKVRQDTITENQRLQQNIAGMINSLSSSISTVNQQERALLREIRERVESLEKTFDGISAATDQAAKITQLREHLKILKEKLDQRESMFQDLKKSCEIMKRENTDLRDFKQRHVDSAEDVVREVKARKHSSPIKRMLGFRI
ncbi:MAG TPA: MerR family transcriptional regulator [bacterium]|nr:MerR family transcriptional regulator [bacterium]